MNPLLILFILIFTVLLWFLLAFSFNFFGKIVTRLKDDAKKAMFEEKNDGQKENVDNEN